MFIKPSEAREITEKNKKTKFIKAMEDIDHLIRLNAASGEDSICWFCDGYPITVILKVKAELKELGYTVKQEKVFKALSISW